MKIGIVGMGCIGTANAQGFATLGHEVIGYDPKIDSALSDLLPTEISFVCVPTPTLTTGECDTSNVVTTLQTFADLNYKGIIAIRSTVNPGFTETMVDKFKNLHICFVPEFVRERCALDDFLNAKLVAVGTNDHWIFRKLSQIFCPVCKNVIQLTPNESEILKYFNNVYAALRVTFANVMYEICQKFDSDYMIVKKSYMLSERGGDCYLDVNASLRGYGGMCLPKDVKALNHLLREYGLKLDLLAAIDHDNSQFDITVFNGMRHG